MFVIRNGPQYVRKKDGKFVEYTSELKDAKKYLSLFYARKERDPTQGDTIASLKMEIDRTELVGNKFFR